MECRQITLFLLVPISKQSRLDWYKQGMCVTQMLRRKPKRPSPDWADTATVWTNECMHRAHMHNTYMYSYICTPRFTRIIIFALCKGVKHSLTLIAEFRIVTLNSTRRVMRNRGSGFRLTLLVSRNRTSKKSFVSRKLKAHITVFVSSPFNLRYDNRSLPGNNEVSQCKIARSTTSPTR